MNENSANPSNGMVQPNGPKLPQVSVPSVPSAPARPVYEAGDRERVLLILALCLGILAADLLLSMSYNWLGLGIPVGVAAWYGVLLWYVGPKRLAETHTRLFFGAILLLALTFVFFSNGWFRFWNQGALLVLLTVHAFQLSGVTCRPWDRPAMLWERFGLLIDGLFGRLGALGAVFQKPAGPAARQRLMAGVGVLVTLPLLLIAALLLADADLVFEQLTADLFYFIGSGIDETGAKVLLGLFAAPFLFSLLYALGHPTARECKEKARSWSLDSIVSIMALAGLDALYLIFVGVQSAALFGGPEYLATMGISYAEYARSGFFQLVFVVILNLVVMLTLMQLTRREGKGWPVMQVLATLLVLLSGVILISAAWRMSLYVMAYGLSFRRVLTYWGMVMMALLLAAACVKVWRAEFKLFRFAAVAALAGWLVLNYASVDRIVARYNVDSYRNGTLESLDLYYLSSLSYEALPVVGELRDTVPMPDYTTLGTRLTARHDQAVWECTSWETWSIPAWEWNIGWDG